MDRQRGQMLMQVAIYAAIAIAVLGALAGLVAAWNHYISGVDKKGYDRGRAEVTAEVNARDNAALQAALIAQKHAEERADQLEDAAELRQTNASINYAKGVKDGQAKTQALLVAAGDGSLRLRDPGATGSSAADCAPGAAGAAAARGPGGDGRAGAQLSGASTAFLLSLTGEADDLARQLTAAQAVIVSDRLLCNAP